MKKLYTTLPLLFILFIGLSLTGLKKEHSENFSNSTLIQKKDIYDLSVNEMLIVRRMSANVKEFKLFERSQSDNPGQSSVLRDASNLKIDRVKLREILNKRETNIDLVIPVGSDQEVVLNLTQVEIKSKDFRLDVIDQSGKKQTYIPDGVHYRGVINNDEHSIASVSVFDDFVMGVMSDVNGNYVLGSIKQNESYTDEYVFYNDNDLLVMNNFKCGIDETNEHIFNRRSVISDQNASGNNDNPLAGRRAADVFFVCDYEMYLQSGNNVQLVGNYVSGMFNSVATIYQNEFLKVQISSIAVYTVPDPYRNTNNSVQILFAFGRNTQDNFNGDLAHLLSTRNISAGGIAWINVLCTPYSGDSTLPYGRFAYSNIQNTYNNYPVYSWTVNVVAHEMGHNYGSMHTHACVWPLPNGGIGAIDSCYIAEPSGGNPPCFSGQRRSVGTIMSYCYLWSPSGDTSQGGGVNFRRGFGPLPGDTIRLRYNQGACFGPTVNSSEIPIAFNLLPNYPNPFNPTTNLKFALPEDANVSLTVYDIRGREVARLMNNRFFTQGIFTYLFDASVYNLTSGIYFYRIDAVSPGSNRHVYSNIRKMVLLK